MNLATYQRTNGLDPNTQQERMGEVGLLHLFDHLISHSRDLLGGHRVRQWHPLDRDVQRLFRVADWLVPPENAAPFSLRCRSDHPTTPALRFGPSSPLPQTPPWEVFPSQLFEVGEYGRCSFADPGPLLNLSRYSSNQERRFL